MSKKKRKPDPPVDLAAVDAFIAECEWWKFADEWRRLAYRMVLHLRQEVSRARMELAAERGKDGPTKWKDRVS